MAKAPTEVIDTLDLAMLRVQAALQPPPLDRINPHFKNPYTSFQAAREAIVPLCAANDISVTQDVTTVIDARGCFASVVTVLTHASGQQRTYGPLLIPAQSQTAQHVAGAVTYGRRISLLASFCLAGEEDLDGEEQRLPAEPPKPAARPPQRPAGASQETRPTSPPPTAPRASQAAPAAPKPKTAKAAQPRPGEFWVYETVIDETFTDDSQDPARPWHKTTIYAKDAAGERLRASTFDTTVGAKAEDFCQSREPVNLKLAPSERDARYTDLLDVEPVHPSEPEPEPESNTLPLDGPEDDIPF